MGSRRVSLPVQLGVPPCLYSSRLTSSPSPTRLCPSPLLRTPSPSGRRSLPSTPGTRRSLPGTPPMYSPHRTPLPNLDELFPTTPSTSSSSENSPSRFFSSQRRFAPRTQISLRDSGFMENHSREEDKIPTNGRTKGKLRSFQYKHGSVVDNGFKAKAPQRGESRRATCPEIFLTPDSNKPVKKAVLRVYGSRNSGKKTVASVIYNHACSTIPQMVHKTSNVVDTGEPKITNFLLNDEEVQLEVLIEAALEFCPFSSSLTIYVVVYNVDSRESFKNAANILFRIFVNRSSEYVPVVLIGNKIDLKRNRIVTTLEGRSMAKIYKCGFVETSALMDMNTDIAWADILRQLQNPNGESWLDRMRKKGRNIARSCEEVVHRIIP